MSKWIPVTYREATEEEREMYGFEIMYDCELPEDGQEVLITSKYGIVDCTTYHDDYGSYFEYFYEVGMVIAWMPLPEPYAKEENNDD